MLSFYRPSGMFCFFGSIMCADGSVFAAAVSAVAGEMSLLEFLIPQDQTFDEGKPRHLFRYLI